MIDYSDTDWLRKAMATNGVGVSQLAAATGMPRSQIQRIRNGQRPRIDTATTLVTAIVRLSQSVAA